MARRRQKKRPEKQLRQKYVPSQQVLKRGRERIEHVVVLMLENRSFDHLLGYLDHPNDDYPGFARKLADSHFPNPIWLGDPKSETADISPGAEPVLLDDPPHGHESIKHAMNGRRWRSFRMNGFADAYRQKLAGHEHIPHIYWSRLKGLGVGAGVVLAAATQEYCRISVSRGWGGYLTVTAVAIVVTIPVVLHIRNLASLTGRARDVVIGSIVGDVVLGAALHATWHGYWGHWVSLAVTAGVYSAGIVVLIGQAQAKQLQKPRVVGADLPAASAKIMQCFTPEKIPVLAELARQFVVCTQWYSSVPGGTWPNRQFLHAATSAGTVDITIDLYDDTTIFDQLGDGRWRIYYDGMAQVMCYPRLWNETNAGHWRPMAQFYDDVAVGGRGLPDYTFIEPCHDGPTSNSQHPGNNQDKNDDPPDFQRGEALVARIYESLCDNQELFEKTLLLITYDEHGGTFDHEAPKRAPAPALHKMRGSSVAHIVGRLVALFVENRNSPFDFKVLGVRVPTIVISPWVETGHFDDTLYDHTSVIASLRHWFTHDAKPLNRRDAEARSFLHLVTSRDKARSPMPPVRLAPEVAAATAPRMSPPPLPRTQARLGRPATVADDLRHQLVDLRTRVGEKLDRDGVPAPPVSAQLAGGPAGDDDEVVARFQQRAERVVKR